MISDVQYAIDNNGSTVSGKKLIDELNQLNKDLVNDEIVREFTEEEINLNQDLKYYNESLNKLNKIRKVTWKTGPWLYLECYLYQLVNVWIIEACKRSNMERI